MIVILTHSYPFGNGEEFLHKEMQSILPMMSFDIAFLPIYSGGKEVSHDSKVSYKVLSLPQVAHSFKWTIKKVLLLLRIFTNEIIFSPDRIYYLKRFRFYFAYLKNAFAFTSRLEQLMDGTKLLYVYWFNDYVLYSALLKKLGYDFKLVVRAHGGDVYEYQHIKSDFIFPFRYFQLCTIDHLVPISLDAKDHIISKFGKKFSNKIKVFHLGTFFHGLNPSSKSTAFTIVSVSSFHYYKRITFLIQSLINIQHDVVWFHFGSGGDEEKQSFNLLSKLPSNIKANMMGYTNNEDLMKFFSSTPVDLFINVSASEGIPVSIMEAISFGIPVLAPNVGGIREIVNDNTGILFNSSSKSSDIAQILTQIIKKEISLPGSAQIHDFWKNHFSDSNYHNFYNEVLCVG